MTIRNVPESMQKLYQKTQTGKASPRRAIRMQCYECCGYDRAEVSACTDEGCPLYRYRPKLRGSNAAQNPNSCFGEAFFASNVASNDYAVSSKG